MKMSCKSGGHSTSILVYISYVGIALLNISFNVEGCLYVINQNKYITALLSHEYHMTPV